MQVKILMIRANRGNPNTEFYTPAWLIQGSLNAAGIDQFDFDPASSIRRPMK